MNLQRRVDSIFTCLGHPYCRAIVDIVTKSDEPITLAELAEEIDSHSYTDRTSGSNVDPIESTRIKLYHHHLPKLADAELIDYDPDSGRVSSAPATSHLSALVKIAVSIAEVM